MPAFLTVYLAVQLAKQQVPWLQPASSPLCMRLLAFNKARKTILINKRNNFQCTLLQKQQANVPNETHAPTFLISPARHCHKERQRERVSGKGRRGTNSETQYWNWPSKSASHSWQQKLLASLSPVLFFYPISFRSSPVHVKLSVAVETNTTNTKSPEIK